MLLWASGRMLGEGERWHAEETGHGTKRNKEVVALCNRTFFNSHAAVVRHAVPARVDGSAVTDVPSTVVHANVFGNARGFM